MVAVGKSRKVVSLSTVFPTPCDAARGLFVRARLQQLSTFTQVKVVAPVAAWGRHPDQKIPPCRHDQNLEVLHPRWIYLPGTGVLTAFLLFVQMIWPLARLRKHFPFELLDAHFGYPEGIAAALLAGVFRVPFTITLRGSELLHAQHGLRRRGIRWAIRRASRIVAVSGELRQFAIRLGAHPDRVKCIPNGVDAGLFHRRSPEQSRQRHGLPARERILLMAGHLIELKGHAHVIRAVQALRSGNLPVRLLIAGGSPGRGVASQEPSLRRLVAELHLQDQVTFLGQVSPDVLAELMSAADLFCLASSREGCPNVVNEALACGTPVVATDVGAIREMIPSEEYGLILPRERPELFPQVLRTALEKSWDREAIALLGQSRSWSRVGAEVYAEIQEIFEERDNLARSIPEASPSRCSPSSPPY